MNEWVSFGVSILFYDKKNCLYNRKGDMRSGFVFSSGSMRINLQYISLCSHVGEWKFAKKHAYMQTYIFTSPSWRKGSRSNVQCFLFPFLIFPIPFLFASVIFYFPPVRMKWIYWYFGGNVLESLFFSRRKKCVTEWKAWKKEHDFFERKKEREWNEMHGGSGKCSIHQNTHSFVKCNFSTVTGLSLFIFQK